MILIEFASGKMWGNSVSPADISESSLSILGNSARGALTVTSAIPFEREILVFSRALTGSRDFSSSNVSENLLIATTRVLIVGFRPVSCWMCGCIISSTEWKFVIFILMYLLIGYFIVRFWF